MASEDHIFTAVPTADVESVIDWRLPASEAGKYLLAFDGTALLLLELWRRLSAAPMA